MKMNMVFRQSQRSCKVCPTLAPGYSILSLRAMNQTCLSPLSFVNPHTVQSAGLTPSQNPLLYLPMPPRKNPANSSKPGSRFPRNLRPNDSGSLPGARSPPLRPRCNRLVAGWSRRRRNREIAGPASRLAPFIPSIHRLGEGELHDFLFRNIRNERADHGALLPEDGCQSIRLVHVKLNALVLT